MNQQAMGALAGILVCLGIFLLILIGIQILFLLNLHRTLAEVHEDNREMSPGMVWLNLIPLFNLIWGVITVTKLTNSLEREFQARGSRTSDEGFGKTTGMIWAWGNIANAVLSVVQNVAQAADMAPIAMLMGLLSLPLGLAILICFIMFWVQTHGYKVRLRKAGPGYAPGGLEEDYDEMQTPRHTEDDYRRYEQPRDRDEF